MRDSIHLYLRFLGVSLRAQMQYRASFVILSVATFLATSIEIIGIWVLFYRFTSLRGWTLPEVAVFYGQVNVALAVGDAFARGFDVFGRMVQSGDFDRLLLRPRNTALQVAGQDLPMFRVGRLAQGLIVLIWAMGAMGLSWTASRVLLAALAVVGCAAMFYGLWVLQATLAFWTVESLEIMNAFTYGGAETAQFPLPIYRPWFRKFFTFVIPLACVAYFPALALMGKPDPLGTPRVFQWLSPLAGVAFMAVSFQAWKIGVRHYRSTGS
jgi:ABC-2 type transport system permease protein